MLQIVRRYRTFIVKCKTPICKRLLDEYTKRFLTYKLDYNPKTRKYINKPDKMYVSIRNDTYIFITGSLKDFIIYLRYNNIRKEDIEMLNGKTYKPDRIYLDFIFKYPLRDYQQNAVDIITNDNCPATVLIPFPTGYGKGVTSIKCMVEIGERVGILILSRYIDKWVEELLETTNLETDDIFIVSGSKKLVKLIELADRDELPPIIIFSLSTISKYITMYEKAKIDMDFPYTFTPHDIIEKTKIGVIVNDESHQAFYALFKTMLYFNSKRFIGMTATLESENYKVRLMHEMLFPKEDRIDKPSKKRYVNSTGIKYSFRNKRMVKTESTHGYSHVMLEQSLFKYGNLLRDYTNMIFSYIESDYVKKSDKGDKCLIILSTVELCKYMRDAFRQKYKQYKCNKYTNDEEYDIILETDVIFSTHQS